MSPRSHEFVEQARDRAAAAKELLAAGHLEAAVSAAYYSMLYAARAALSERDELSTRRPRVRAATMRPSGLPLRRPIVT